MALNLDLGSSKAKLARAREHLRSLQRETTAGVNENAAYAVRFSPVDPQTGWCSIDLVPQQLNKPALGPILGDVVHNLRSALDYVITALVEASPGAELTAAHQFPIFVDASKYAEHVGSATEANAGGVLRGIVHGLTLIEKWQPYYTQPDPRTDPLWGLYRFSNADKHREPLEFLPIPVGELKIAYNGIVVEQNPGPEITSWRPNQNIHVTEIRFDPPRACNLRAEGNLTLNPRFETPPWKSDAELAVSLSGLESIVNRVAVMLDLFDQL